MVSKRSQRSLIIAITIGSVLEWYEIFLYIYWAPVIQGIFFDFTTQYADLVSAILVFAFGFLSRPLGGLIFGYIGDRWGRKRSVIFSIILVALPSIAIGFIPSYETWSAFSAVLLVIMRLLQGIPAGGELPGAMCYLEEIAPPGQRKYVGSYTFVGAQVGGIISMLTCMLFEIIFPHKFLITWGWRISFFIGGVIGLLGSYLRNKLKESPYFEHLEEKHQISKEPITEAFRNYKLKMLLAFLISIAEVIGFFIISIFPVIYFKQIFGTSIVINSMISATFLTVSAITIPIFGKFCNKYRYKPIFFISLLGIIVVSFPFYFAVKNTDFILTLICIVIFIFFLNFQLALLPSLLTDLFPTAVRFTCIGFSFNICDGLIGGIAPFLAIYFVHETNNVASFVLIFTISAIISLIALFFIKEKKRIPQKG